MDRKTIVSTDEKAAMTIRSKQMKSVLELGVVVDSVYPTIVNTGRWTTLSYSVCPVETNKTATPQLLCRYWYLIISEKIKTTLDTVNPTGLDRWTY